MDIGPVLSNFYRYNFKDLLLNSERVNAEKFNQQPLIADIFVSGRPSVQNPPAPQDLGEVKQAFSSPNQDETLHTPQTDIKQTGGREMDWSLDTAARNAIDLTYYKPSLTIRQEMEEKVRRCKKSNQPCPYVDKNFHCSALFIRCGERIQYARPETIEQKNMPHICLYRPKATGTYILIIDDNKAVRDFCKSTIEYFFNYSADKIITTASGFEALNIVNRFKIEGKHFGLVICDTGLSGVSGVEVVNELFDRNYNLEVILTRDQDEKFYEPLDFKGLQQILPEKTMVKKIIVKPFHSSAFVDSLKSLDMSFSSRAPGEISDKSFKNMICNE